MNEQLKERLNKILPRLESSEFLESFGQGGDIDFYIFDYPPEEEIAVRDHIKVILEHLAKKRPDLRVHHVNLFELIVAYLKERNLLDRAFELQQKKGDEALKKALAAPLNETKVAQTFVAKAKPEEADMVIMTGVGNAWPLLRSHTLLSNLHALMGMTPLVMFYPGVYDGQGLSLFGRLEDRNYYRAFRLVD
jgi:hypothetical protein